MTVVAGLLLRSTGWLAAGLLLVTLVVSALSRHVGARPRWLKARRAVGIGTALAALGHASVAWLEYLNTDGWEVLRAVPWLRSGALALVVLLALLATSFQPRHPRFTIHAWSVLHRLVHAAVLLVAHHLLMAPFVPRSWVLAWGAGVGLTYAMRIRIAPRP